MKKQIRKKLFLGKKTIARLNEKEMDSVHGASILIPSCDCSVKSCSHLVHCCPPITEGDDQVEFTTG